MRSRTSRGVSEWSGDEDLYMGSPYSIVGSVWGLPILFRDHRRGSGGPLGGSTCPGGPYGLNIEGNQPLGGLGAKLPLGPMRLGLGETLEGAPP